jgi:hypothetical protein
MLLFSATMGVALLALAVSLLLAGENGYNRRAKVHAVGVGAGWVTLVWVGLCA